MLNQASSLLGQTSFTPAQVIYGVGDVLPAFVAPLQAETTTLLAAMTVQPSAARKTIINQAIYDLKAQGLWTTFDLFYAIAAHDGQAGRVNWANPAQVMSVNGTMTFTTDRGYMGDGVAAWLGTGVTCLALTKFVQDNAAMGVWQQNNVTHAFGIVGQMTTNRNTIATRTVGNLASTRLNTSTLNTVAMADASGHLCVTRTIAASHDRYKNGAFLDTSASVSATRLAEEILLFRNITSYNGSQVLAAAHFGSALTGAQIASLNTILQTYMVAVGAA